MRCPMCDEDNKPIGSLGHVNHYRCRACGWWFSLTRKTKTPTWNTARAQRAQARRRSAP